jgi:hypothetical protein
MDGLWSYWASLYLPKEGFVWNRAAACAEAKQLMLIREVIKDPKYIHVQYIHVPVFTSSLP